jgi:uncharacterized protein YacL
MTLSSAFIRTLFLILSLLFMITFAIEVQPQSTVWTYLWGGALGGIAAVILMSLELVFKRFNLRAFNTAIIGLFFGYLMSLALTVIFNAILSITGVHPHHFFVEMVKIALFLFGTYSGVIMAMRASDEIYVSIPFVKFTPTAQQTKDILIDLSALGDFRMIDLAASGIMDRRLLLPRFLLKELHKQEENPDEMISSKARRSLEVVKKLEILPDLHLRYQDTDFPEVKEVAAKMLRLARLLDADLLSADGNPIQMARHDGIRVINIHALSSALKPLMQRGELLKIKIQRSGKEELQGVGYLEEGTMVVVNGGGHYIGKTIAAKVLSVKHTASGRMVFCNVADEKENADDEEIY